VRVEINSNSYIICCMCCRDQAERVKHLFHECSFVIQLEFIFRASCHLVCQCASYSQVLNQVT
jgi:hypothetical protein